MSDEVEEVTVQGFGQVEIVETAAKLGIAFWIVMLVLLVSLMGLGCLTYEVARQHRPTAILNSPAVWTVANTTLSMHADDDSAFSAPDAQVPNDPPPSRIKVGPFFYQVVYRADRDMPELYGETSPRLKKIALNISQTHEDLKDTVLHEVFHACDDLGRAQDGGGETPPIKAITPTLIQVLHDNPSLVEWLRK